MQSVLRATFIFSGLLAFAAIGWCQSAQSTATIPVAGRVTDSAFNPIPNVSVTLKTLGSDKAIAKVETDQTGAFTFPAVPAGAKELYFEKVGFMPVTSPIQVLPEEKNFNIGSVIMLIGKGTEGQTVEPLTRAQTFKAAPGQAFSLDLDSAPGVFSQWRHDDLGSLNSMQAVLRVPRIRKDRNQPTFVIYLQNQDHQGVANDLGLQLVALGGRLPMKIRLIGHTDGKPIQEIPLQTTLTLNDELKVEVTWVTPQLVTFKVGPSEIRAVRIPWVVSSVVITGSTGELKTDPLLFGTVAP